MRIRSLPFFLLAVFALAAFTSTARAIDQKAADAAVNKFLAAQKALGGGQDDAQSMNSVIADLNGDGKAEIVLLWVTLGPTYSSNALTVLADAGKGFAEAASLPLTGQADKVAVKDGVMLVDLKVLAKKDPLCCPSISKQEKFRWMGGKKIAEVK